MLPLQFLCACKSVAKIQFDLIKCECKNLTDLIKKKYGHAFAEIARRQ